jgi:hypothetical protein
MEICQNGEQKPFLPEPYNWRTYPAMNAELWKVQSKFKCVCHVTLRL